MATDADPVIMSLEQQLLTRGACLITSKHARLAGHLLRKSQVEAAWITTWRG